MIAPAGLRLVVTQCDARGPQDLEAANAQLQGKVNVAMGHRQADFVKTPACLEHVAADREKGASHGTDSAAYLPSSARPSPPHGLIAPVMERQPLPVE